jgi:uncharacterized protein YqeY
MSLTERIQADLVAAMKSKDKTRLSALRLIKTALKNKEIDTKGGLSEADEMQVLMTLVKQRSESIEMYEKGGRQDLAESERAEREIVQHYLPEEVSSEEVERTVAAVVEELGATSPKDMGSVMKTTMERLKATGKTVDGKSVNAVVRRALTSQ